MPKTAKLSERDAEIIREERHKTKNKHADQRMYAVQLRAEGWRNKAVAEKLDVSPVSVSRWVAEYLKRGIEALVPGNYGGNRRNLTDEEEVAFLEQFRSTAERGQIITVAEIAKAYDEQFGTKHASPSTVYYLIHKHKWRKVMPRSKHPNSADEEAIEASKKLTIDMPS